ncbi:MAG TPA: 1,4-alpha-glucan branching protein domain-containing protein [Chloroflexota bacterium]|jgi:1,4-alpha-glucan branching enzyme
MTDGQPIGYFTFVLHSHLPYVRRAGRWPHGEEMIHEALAETYLPLLVALDDLQAEGLNPRLTIGLTPILLEQIGDADVLASFEQYLDAELEGARRDAARYSSEQPGLADLARFYERFYARVRGAFVERYGGDVVAQFRRLCQLGHLDVLTSAATHGYLPLMGRDSTIYGQLKVGRETSRRHMERRSQGIWLPECAYRPAYLAEGGRYKPGIEEFLAGLNLLYFFTDTHVVAGGRQVGKIVGDVAGPYGAPLRRLVRPISEAEVGRERSVLRPYYVGQDRVAVYARDPRTGMQVWSAAWGYPGDFAYREFHRKDPGSGLQYWRVSGADVDLGGKQLYEPLPAERQAIRHAEHFVDLVASSLREFHSQSGRPGLIVSAYDTELFGHWWFEGVTWLREVLRRLATHPEVGLTTANDYLASFPPDEVLQLPESSWGAGGDHSTWYNDQTSWMWPLIHAAEERMEELVGRHPEAVGDRARVLAQVARELLLLESSDWPFLVSTGQAAEYASARFQQHMARFNRLAMAADHESLDDETRRFLAECERGDNPFPDIDYRVFAARERIAPAVPA